jgi:hypothetical protein
MELDLYSFTHYLVHLLGYFGQVDGCNGPDLWYGLPQLIFLNKA